MTLRDQQPPQEDPTDLAHRLAALLEQYPEERQGAQRALQGTLSGEENNAPLRTAQKLSEIPAEYPAPILRASGRNGAVLSEGQICLLAAEGGIGKSPFTTAIAVSIAMLPDKEVGLQPLYGKILEGTAGKVLLVTYEDPPGVTAARAQQLAKVIDHGNGDTQASDSLNSIEVLDLHGMPIYGAPAGATYNSRPEALRGWNDLWEAAARLKPKLIVIDPALQAYASDSNSPAPVREYLGVLSRTLASNCPGSGILMTAHSTKDSRRRGPNGGDPFDPGMVAGSGGWTDATRGLMTMTWADSPNQRLIAIPKANWGPSRIKMVVNVVRDTEGGVIACTSASDWLSEHAEVPQPEEHEHVDRQQHLGINGNGGRGATRGFSH